MAGDGLHVVEAGSGGSVLGYATRPRKLESGTRWLLGIVSVTQASTLIKPAVTWGWLIKNPSVWPDWLSEHGLYDLGVSMILAPLCALLVIALSSVVLLRIPGPRRSSVVMIWVALGFMAIAADRDYWLNLPLGEQASVTKQICFGIEILARLAISSYPLILLTRVIEWNYGYLNPARTRTIWWLTAGACMLIALPTVLNWTLTHQPIWNDVIVNSDDWLTTVEAFGVLTGNLVPFGVCGILAWTILGGRAKGRAALMICAAMLMVGAVALEGSQMLSDGFDLWLKLPLSGAALPVDYAQPFFESLGIFIFAVTFPLTVRLALNLPDVRAKLDGMTAGDGSDGTILPAHVSGAEVVQRSKN